MLLQTIPSKTALEIHYLGPAKSEGPLPAFFYFALSGQDSLLLDPYNQPIQFLPSDKIRCYSFSLPSHGPKDKPEYALKTWAEEFKKGNDPIAHFLNDASINIQQLIDQQWVDQEKIALAGLSRGAFIASLLATLVKQAKWLLGYAPLTSLATVQEFHSLNLLEISEKYSLLRLAHEFIDRKVNFFMGNRDEKVSTDRCFQFVRSVADHAYQAGIRSPSIELNLRPSIGYLGHGTSKETFKEGAEWVKKEWAL